MRYDANHALLETELDGVKLVNRGKVRDVYDLGDALLFVATDRLSAFDVVMPNGIPRKGEVLTRISLFWFDFLKNVYPICECASGETHTRNESERCETARWQHRPTLHDGFEYEHIWVSTLSRYP